MLPRSSPLAADARRTHLAERVVLHGAPIDFRTLCERAVPTDTQFIVLDLDRTVHLGRNMGELLGWELGALNAYGAGALAELEPTRPRGRLLLAWQFPLGLARYTAAGVRNWAVPGLTYFFWGKLASSREALRRRSFLRFGPEPVRNVQRIPQTALLSLLSAVPVDTLTKLAHAVWQRHASEQVIAAADIAWLRTRCPGVKIILSSASPAPMVAVAARELGVDDYAASSCECHDGYLEAPVEGLRGVPRRLAPPSRVTINTGVAKIEDLARRCPEALAPGARAVGITDTGYGEDHAWADHFARVIDINSDSPFLPIVQAGSPLREIHSAAVLTAWEREHGALDPRRKVVPKGPPRELSRDEIARKVAPFAERAESLARAYEDADQLVDVARGEVQSAARELSQKLDDAVAAYNAAAPEAQHLLLAALAPLRAAESALLEKLRVVERPLSEIAFTLTRTLEAAREALVADAAVPA